MPTNVKIDYVLAEREYLNAKTREEKIIALQKMISFCPKHKGTENLLRSLRERLAKLKKEEERKKGRKEEGISKEGSAQVVILGFTNVGKSLLLKKLTNANPKISEYPFTTTKPLPGMIDIDGAKIQVVDTPALLRLEEDSNERNRPTLGIARNADLLLIVSKNRDEMIQVKELISRYGFRLNKKKPRIVVRKYLNGINVIGKELIEGNENIVELLRNFGYMNIEIVVKEKCNIEDLLLSINPSVKFVNALFIINEKDKLYEENGEEIFMDISIKENIEKLKSKIWNSLGLIRVYTKEPGQPPKMDIPVVIRSGETLRSVAEQLHKDFIKKFRFARVWGKSAKFDGQKVGLDHVLSDKDIVEIHLK